MHPFLIHCRFERPIDAHFCNGGRWKRGTPANCKTINYRYVGAVLCVVVCVVLCVCVCVCVCVCGVVWCCVCVCVCVVLCGVVCVCVCVCGVVVLFVCVWCCVCVCTVCVRTAGLCAGMIRVVVINILALMSFMSLPTGLANNECPK